MNSGRTFRRSSILVLEMDGFAKWGRYDRYLGYEIDPTITPTRPLPEGARLLPSVCLRGRDLRCRCMHRQPPICPNQELPDGWRERAATVLKKERTGVAISGLANAWQYFVLLALASTHRTGLCALIVPYEWVSRPSAAALRDHITAQRWNVTVYRLVDATFSSVLTTASITVVDKSGRDGRWSYFEETADGAFGSRIPKRRSRRRYSVRSGPVTR